ncbi:MAG: hypothetical protein ACT4OK_10970 [Gemmobacter sp.]
MNIWFPGADENAAADEPGPRVEEALPPLGSSAALLRTFGQPLAARAPSVAETKKDSVAQASEVKRLLLGGADDLRRLGTAMREGNDLADTEEARILASGNPYDILTRLGPETAANTDRLYRSMRDDAFALDQGRDPGEIAGDAALGAGAGFVSGLGGLAALGAGLVNDRAGAVVSDGVALVGEGLRGFQSEELQDQREIGAVRSQLDQEDIDRQYEEDLEEGVSYPGLRRFGREILSAGADLAQNPALAGDMVAEGIGSLIGGAGLGRVAAMGAAKVLLKSRGITGANAQAFLRTPEGRRMVSELAETRMPLAIGGLEAGGAYAGIQSEIQAMDERDLLENSPEYRELRSGGMDHETARDRIANLAGLEGGAIAGLVGVATGKLTARFEANPLNLGRGSDDFLTSLRSLGRESLAQGVEEGAQGVAGSLAENRAIQRYADENRDIGSGLGMEAIRGTVAGVGMVGALRAPDLAFAAGRDLFDLGEEGVETASKALKTAAQNRLKSVEADIDSQSPVGNNALAEAATTLRSSLETVQKASVPKSAENADGPATGMSAERMQEISEQASQLLDLEPEVLSDLVQQFEAGELSPQDEADTALDIYKRVQAFDAITTQELQAMRPEMRSALRSASSAVDTMLSNPVVARALERAKTLTSAEAYGALPEVNSATLATPEVAKALEATVTLAQSNPAGIDPRFVNQVLNQRRALKLSDSVRAKLEAAALIVKAMNQAEGRKTKNAEATAAELKRRGLEEKPRKPSNIVREEIREKGRNNEYRQFSLSRHQSEIIGAIDRGDIPTAQKSLDALRNFGEHMANKLAAAEASAALKRSKNNALSFRTWTGARWVDADAEGSSSIYINPFSPNNVQLLKDIRIDAATVQAVYNNILSIYGPLSNLEGTPFTAAKAKDEAPASAARPTADVNTQTDIQNRSPNGGADSNADEVETGAGEVRAEGEAEAGAASAAAEQDRTGADQGERREGDDRAREDDRGEGTDADTGRDGSEPETRPDPEPLNEAPETEATSSEPLSFDHLPAIGDDTPKFSATFSVDIENVPLMKEPAPASKAIDVLKGTGKAREDERFTLPYFLDRGQTLGWAGMIGTEGKGLIDRVNAKLKIRQKNLRGMSPLEALNKTLAGESELNWLELRDSIGLNLVDPSTGEYDARLVQSAMLASQHWVMTSSGTQNLDDSEVAEVFGTTVDKVTEQMRVAVNSGRGVKPSVESLARTIRAFWGVTPKANVPISDVRGLSEHMAIQFLDAMEGEAGRFTTSRTFEVVDREDKMKNVRVIYLRNPATDDLRQALMGSKSVLADLFAPEASKPFYFGQPPKEKRLTQKGNPLSPLGDKMREALKMQRETPFYRNRPQVDLMKALGQETWSALMGHRHVNEGVMNRLHQLSVEGLNNSIRNSWEGVMEYDAQLEAYAAARDRDSAEVPVHFDYYVASNERMMIEGFNPQADKGLREVAVATWSTLDLTDDRQHEAFWLTVGQSSGMKTEKGTRAKNAAKAEADMRARFPESIGILKRWLAGPTQALSTEKRQAVTAEIRRALKDENANPKLMHAILSVARYDLAMEDAVPGSMEGVTSFRHGLALEADGKTDGPINAIMHFTSGMFTGSWLLNMRRGGFFPGEKDKTLNAQFERDGADLYEVAGQRANTLFAANRLVISATPEGKMMMGALQRVLGLLGEVEIGDDGNIRIGRKGMKNPLTITGYGSGENGIAGKVTALMLEKLYAALTAMEEARVSFADPQIQLDSVLPGTQNLEQFRRDLSLLTQRRLVKTRDGWKAFSKNQKGQRPGPLADLSKGRDFKLTPEQWSMLQANIRAGYVRPMREAIAEVFGNAQTSLEEFQKASQVQSLVLKDLFWQEVKRRLAERRERGELKPGAFLSEEDYRNILQDLRKYGAFIEPIDSNENSLNLSVSEGEQTSEEFARDYDGRYAGGATLPAPRLAGVSAAPMVTISRGDGRMMVNFYGDPGSVEAGAQRTLGVFDGLEMPADLIESLSERINKAVADAWLANPAKDVADSFSDWLRQGKDGPLAQVSDEAWKQIATVLEAEPAQEAVENALLGLNDDLQTGARSIQARKNALKRIGFSADHMASGESPYVQEGEEWNGEGRFIDWLNGIYAEELAKLAQAGRERRVSLGPVVEPTDPALAKRLRKAGLKVKVARAMGKSKTLNRIGVAEMAALLDDPSVPEASRTVIRELAKVMPEYTFMVGDREALAQWRAETYPELEDRLEIDLGQTDASLGIIFIANISVETILHEMLHGALGKVLTDHYAGIGRVSSVQKAAITNLERLMVQFADMDFSTEDHATKTAAAAVQGEIRAWLGEDLEGLSMSEEEGGDYLVLRKSAALNEFIAWTLANQNLKQVLKTSKVRAKLTLLKDAVLNGLRRLLGLPEKLPMDMFSNIAWNTGAIVQELRNELARDREADLDRGGDLVLNQTIGTEGRDPRLGRIRRQFEAKVAAHLRQMKGTDRLNQKMAIDQLANDALHRFEAAGFQFTAEEMDTFRVLQAAFASSMKVAPGAMAQTQRIFQNLIRNLTVESLMKDRTNDLERAEAQAKFNAIVGKTGTEADPFGRSNLMSSVMALAMVDEGFRSILEKMELPKDRSFSFESVDVFLESLGDSMMNTLGTAISEEGRSLTGSRNRSVREALDQLGQVIGRIEEDRRSWAEKKAYEALNGGDGKARDLMEGLGTRLADWGGRNRVQNPRGLREMTEEAIRSGARLMAGVVSESRGEAIAEALLGLSNETKARFVPTAFKELLAEVIGLTRENKGVLGLVNKVKSEVSALRQDYREKMPEIFARQFKGEMEDADWAAMHRGLGQTDLAVLGETRSAAEIRSFLLDEAKFADVMAEAEDVISGAGRKTSRTMLKKADELAKFMATREIAPTNQNLLKNAWAIGSLFGETGQSTMAQAGGPTPVLVQAIDEYTSLRALEMLKDARPDIWERLVRLARDEAEGFDFLLYSLVDLRKTEVARLNTSASRANAWKGYIPEEVADGARLVVAKDAEHNKLVTLGFTRLGDYQGSGFERGRYGYYYSYVGGKSAYAQGVLQTIQRTAMGTDPINGRNMSNLMGGVLAGRQVSQIQTLMQNQQGNGTGEPLIPIYDENGRAVAYERSLRPEMLNKLPRNTHIGEMMGAWAGRQQEERLAQSFNELLVDRLKEAWDEGHRTKRTKEFVSIAEMSGEDEVFADTWNMVPPETKAYIEQVFGTDGFMVRRDMVNNALGYRVPSVKDAWDGASRLDPRTRRMIRDTATLVIGAKALPWMVTAEKAWAAGISVVKNTIVVRSVIVPLSNMASNVLQLMAAGVGIRDIHKGMPAKLVEINQYLQNKGREVELKALIARYRDDEQRLLRLEAELKGLEDANMRMSIWPMIQAGEFNTIADGQTEVDAAISQGKWSEYMQNILDRVPAKLGTVGRYAMITRDTALFRGMSRAVQYGDFLAKSVLYDHLVQREGVKPTEALERVFEEFVPYNVLPGRMRSYMENMGITWFWAYKLRSMKVALNMVRRNPLRAMLMSHGAEVLPDLPGVSVGSPLSDNAANVIQEGRAGYSIGLDMLWSGPGLNPWVNLSS